MVLVDALLQARSSVDGTLRPITVDATDAVKVGDLTAQTRLATVIARLDSLIGRTDFPSAAETGLLTEIRNDLRSTLRAVTSGTTTTVTTAVSGTVALDAASLAALEAVTAVVSGTVALDAATLNALESVTAAVTGSVAVTSMPAVALDAATLAALESVTAAVTGTVALDAPTLAALESITATVGNFPASYPIPAAQVSDLKLVTVANPTANPETGLAKETTLAGVSSGVGTDGATPPAIPGTGVRGWLRSIYDRLGTRLSVDTQLAQPLTDAQLRAAGVPVVGPLTDAQLRAAALGVSGPLTDAQLRASAVAVTGGLTDAQARETAHGERVSTLNDPSGPLAANATFTGQWEDSQGYSTILVAILTDQASAVNGAVIQFSEDPTLGALRSVATTIPANVGSHFSLGTEMRYFRIVYTNGATAQASLRAELLLRRTPPASIMQPLGAPTTDNNMATVVRSHLTGRMTSGAWKPLFVDDKGRIYVTDLEARTLFTLASAARTVNGSSPNFLTGDLSRVAIDVNVTAVGGVGPNLRFFLDRLGADGNYYPIWSPAALTAVGTLSTTVGQGMAVAQSLAAECRLRWEITGTTPSFTFSASVVGK